MRSKGNLLTRFLVSAAAVSVASGLVRPAFPGTELGNARFVEYENTLHGFSIAYPEEWNVIDLGNAVNVVGSSQFTAFERREEAREARGPQSVASTDEAFGDMASVEISFDLSRSFQTPVAFERHVRKMYPRLHWKPAAFRGRSSFKALYRNRHVLVIMKDSSTLMHLSFPVDTSTGLPPALIEKTVDSFEFR